MLPLLKGENVMSGTTSDYVKMAAEVDRLDEEGRRDEAVSLAREVAEQARNADDEGFALFFSGESLCLEGNLEGGETLIRQAAAALPGETLVLVNHAIVLSLLGKTRRAVQILNRSLELKPDDLVALGQKGVCLAKLGYGRESLEAFDRILALDPDNLHALRNRGVALSRLGREKEAMACFDKALAADPADPHAQSEKKILEEEMRLKGTPLGWMVIWARKKVAPAFKRAANPLG